MEMIFFPEQKVTILSQLHSWKDELKSSITKLHFQRLKDQSANQFTGVYTIRTVVANWFSNSFMNELNTICEYHL